MALTRVKSGGVTSGSFVASGSTIPVSSGGTGRTSQLLSSWVLSANISSSSSDVLMTWVKDTGTGIGELIGTDVTHSSGTFTFPSTGIYKLTMDMQGRHPSSANSYVGFQFYSSTDSGSNYSIVWRRLTNNPSGGYFAFLSTMHYEVTNATTQRIQAKTYIAAGSTVFDGAVGYTSNRLYFEKMS